MTDHIIQVTQGGADRDTDNLMGLCKQCHDRKSSMEGRAEFDIPYRLNDNNEKIPTPAGVAAVIEAIKPRGGGYVTP